MTDMNVIVTPMVKVVLPTGERICPLSDLMLESDDPLTISDATLVTRAERWFDLGEGTLRNFVVSRPDTGNILLMPKATFGWVYKENKTDEKVRKVISGGMCFMYILALVVNLAIIGGIGYVVYAVLKHFGIF